MTIQTFETRFENVNPSRACRDLRKQQTLVDQWLSGWRLIVATLVSVFVIVACVQAVLPKPYAGLITLVLLIAAWSILMLTLRKRGRRILTVSPLRAGVTHVSLDEDGFRLRNDAFESLTRWAYIYGAMATPQALLIQYTQYEYYPIEAAAFASSAEMEEVASEIRIRIAAAQKGMAA